MNLMSMNTRKVPSKVNVRHNKTQNSKLVVSHTVYHQLHHCKGGFSLSAYAQQFHDVLVIKHLHCFCLTEKFKLLRKKALRMFRSAFIVRRLSAEANG